MSSTFDAQNESCATLSVRGMEELNLFLREVRETAVYRLNDSETRQKEMAGFELSSVEKRELWDLEDKLHNATKWLLWAEGRLNEKRAEWKQRLKP